MSFGDKHMSVCPRAYSSLSQPPVAQLHVPMQVDWTPDTLICDSENPVRVTFPPSRYGYQVVADLKSRQRGGMLNPYALLAHSWECLGETFIPVNDRVRHVESLLQFIRYLYNRPLENTFLHDPNPNVDACLAFSAEDSTQSYQLNTPTSISTPGGVTPGVAA